MLLSLNDVSLLICKDRDQFTKIACLLSLRSNYSCNIQLYRFELCYTG
jgi:hypothetical protein